MSSPGLPDERSYPGNPPRPEADDNFAVPDDDILALTTGVVKTVKELSDRVHKSKPNDYVDLVKVRLYSGITLIVSAMSTHWSHLWVNCGCGLLGHTDFGLCIHNNNSHVM